MVALFLERQLALPGLSQRWEEGDDLYRPADEPIRTSDYEIADLTGKGSDTIARAFIERHHYSHSYVAARRRFALYHRSGDLVGIAVFSQPMQDASFPGCFEERFEERERRREARAQDPRCRQIEEACDLCGVELGRLVLLDSVAGNGESWFVGECFRRLRREGFIGVLSFSDPIARTRADGTEVTPGHHGGIYQGCNAHFAGRGAASILRLFPDGTVPNPRGLVKVRKLERGWEPQVARLRAYGAPAFDPCWPREERSAWVRRSITAITRPMKHPGNWKYLFPLDRALKHVLPPNPDDYPAPAGGRPAPKWGRRLQGGRSAPPCHETGTVPL